MSIEGGVEIISQQDRIKELNTQRAEILRRTSTLSRVYPNQDHANERERLRSQEYAELKLKYAHLLQQLADLDYYPSDYSEAQKTEDPPAKAATPPFKRIKKPSLTNGRGRKDTSALGVDISFLQNIKPIKPISP